MAFGNAYGDKWSPDLVAKDTEKLKKAGVDYLILSDTIAVGTPQTIGETFKIITAEFADLEIGAHLHISPTNRLENLSAAWENGCRRFDAVINGKGGCPMSKQKMVGNLATTDLLNFLSDKGIKPDLDSEAFHNALMKAAFIFP